MNLRGTWQAGERYHAGDIVARDGGSFVAMRATSAACPGPEWQLLAGRGKTEAASREALRAEVERAATVGDVSSRPERIRRRLELALAEAAAAEPERFYSPEEFARFAIRVGVVVVAHA